MPKNVASSLLFLMLAGAVACGGVTANGDGGAGAGGTHGTGSAGSSGSAGEGTGGSGTAGVGAAGSGAGGMGGSGTGAAGSGAAGAAGHGAAGSAGAAGGGAAGHGSAGMGGGGAGGATGNKTCVDVACVGACEGSCGGTWICDTQVACSAVATQYCGCDGKTFTGSTCPQRAYAFVGTCEAGVSCDTTKVICKIATPVCPTGQVVSVSGSCYGPCVPVGMCACTKPADCPNPDTTTCHNNTMRCGPFVN